MSTELTTTANLVGAPAYAPEVLIDYLRDFRQSGAAPVQATNDGQLMALWLHGRSKDTQRAYGADIKAFMEYAGVELRLVTLGDVHGFADFIKTLPNGEARADKSQARMIAAVRSLLSFASKIGYIGFNVGAAMRQPKIKTTIAERILSEGDTIRMLALETNPRNRALLYAFYDLGARVSEVVGLKWKDVRTDGETAIVTIYGKGSKTRFNRLSATTWQHLQAIKPAACTPDTPVFASRKGDAAITQRQAGRIVLAAAERAGISQAVSSHWLRHAHASHALAHGAGIVEIAEQLGHSSVAVTQVYAHIAPGQSTSRYLSI